MPAAAVIGRRALTGTISGSLPEVVGNTGMLVDPDSRDSICEGLYRILTDNALREHSRRSGLTRAATFTWQRTAEIALTVYRMGC